jgi:hypothetical protein
MADYINNDGDLYTIDEINQAAEENNTTFDDIIEKNQLSQNSKKTTVEGPGKKKPVAVKDATVAGTQNTASKSAKPSSVSQDNPFGKTIVFDPLGITKTNIANAQIAKNPPKPASVKKTESTVKPYSEYKNEYEEKKQKEEEGTFSNYLKESFDAGVSEVVKSIYKAPEYLYNAAAAVTNPIVEGIGDVIGEKVAPTSADKIMKEYGIHNIPADILAKRIKKSDKIIQEYSAKNGGDPLTAIENGNYLGAAKLITGGTVQSFPMMAAAMLSGGSNAALAGIAASTAVSKADQLEEEHPEMGLGERTINSATSGLLESYLGHLFTGASGAAIGRILEKKGAEAGSKLISSGLVNSLSNAIEKNPLIGVLGEVAEESSVELGNQLNDMKSGIRNELDYKSIINAGLIATGMAGTNTVPVYAAKGYMKSKEYNQLKNVNKEIQGLSTQLSNPYINEDDKKIISSRIARLADENKAIAGKSLEKIKALPVSVKTEINTINSDLDNIKNKYLNIVDNSEIPVEAQKGMIDELSLQTKELHNRKASIIEGNYIYDDFKKLPIAEQDKFKELANNKLIEESGQEEGMFKPSKDEIDRKAVNIYNEDLRVKNVAKEVELVQKLVEPKNAAEITKGIGENKPVEIFESPEDLQKAYNDYMQANTDGKNIQDVTGEVGFMLGNQIVINKKLAETFREGSTVGRHELLHKILKSSFTDAAEGQKLKDKFLSVLSAKERSVIEDRLKRGGYTEQDLINAPDEYLTQFFEALEAKEIKYSDRSFLNMWKSFLQPAYKKLGFRNLDFKSGSDVYNFVKDYHKNVSKAGLSERAKSLIEQGKNIESETKSSKPQSEIFKQELADLEENEFDYDPEDYEQQVANLESKIKKAIEKEKLAPKVETVKKEILTEEDEVKEIIKENKSSVASDKVQNIYNTKGKEGAQDIINLFKPITKKIVDKRRDAPDFDRELLTDEIETGVGGILDLITKYNPESGVPLAAYINKYLPVRAIATSKRLLGKEFSKDVTEEKGLMAEETVSETKEKPKYDNALESKVFEPEALEAINKKILSVIRTLKSKIDEPVSINRTVTPLITEIKDEIGKQVDINVKTVMGGKKDNQLKKWLLKNKKYILENMTTTWLMGKGKANKVEGGIPNAIQKSIDGRWVSYPEWIGKTIDRESVSTDQAGRTSGAELVRRLPNVASNVSNEDFLNHILESSGNPIRGRKESLAKAIAEEASFDILLDDFENQGPLFEAFAANQERLGVEINDVLTTAFANQVERGNIKFSKPAVSNSMLFLLKENNWDFNSKELIDFKNSLDDKDQRYYVEFRKKWIRRVGNLLDEYKRIWESNAGVKFEAEAYNKLRKFSKNNTDFILNEAAPDKFNSRNPDLVYKIGKDGRDVIVELKADKTAPHGSTSNSNLLGDEIVFTKGFEGDAEMKSKMENNESRKKALEYLKNNNLSKDGNSLIVSNDVWDNVKGEKTGPSMVITPKTLAQINVGKDIIHIQGNGSFAYEGHNTGELIDVPLIDGNMYVYSRITSVASGKNRRIIERLFFQLGNNWNQKSDYNLIDNPEKFVNQSIKFSKTISPTFNKIIEENKGVEDYKNFSDIVARRRGAGKNRFDIYVPASAADFELLLYNFMGKGAKGEEQKKFFTDTLLKPYANGNDLMDAARQSIKNEYKQLLTEFPDVAKKIEKRTPDGDFTYDQAIRVAMWNDEGVEIPGLSQRDMNKLTDLVNSDPELKAFKEGLIVTGRQGKGWIKPEEYWDANTIITDLHNLTEGNGRKKFLSEFIANAEEMFGKWENGKLVGPNINKVEAVYGTDVREALEDVLYRMTTGKNRGYGKDKETSAWANWVSGSTGAIMFLNVRSAALQLIGAVNFLNLRDNNPYAAAKAFANQKQYWEDFAHIWNSDKMKERRGGLKEDVAAAEIANAAEGSKNKAEAVLSYLLKIGYGPTQIADGLAIASGGAPFYRNRINTYLKEGMNERDAEEAAWDDFTKVSDETQQSGDPRDISKQQASPAGRLLLTFQNTAMQQSRIVKKAFLDLKNGRGDAKTNFAKIAYYIAVQNTMFAVLQQGLFAVAFGDDDEDKDKTDKEKKLNDKLFEVADGVVDTVLRGTGFLGGIVATIKNMAKKYLDEKDKKFKADYAKVVLEGANLSPPIGSKLRKLYNGLQQTKFDKDLIEARGWDVTQDGRVNLGPMYGVTGKLVEATTNVPMDRLVTKVNNASEALNSQNTIMQRIMVGLGWSPYSAGIDDSAGDKKIKEEAKAKRKIEGAEKAKETREKTKDSIANLPMAERIKLKKAKALERREKRRRRKMG